MEWHVQNDQKFKKRKFIDEENKSESEHRKKYNRKRTKYRR